MASYNSAYVGAAIDRAGLLPTPNSGSVGQFLKKISTAGNMAWADVVSVTTQLNNSQKTDMTNLLLFFTNKTIAVSDWQNGIDYTNYPYYADIACSGVTENYYPEVIFYPDDAVSGYFAPICESVTGTVRIFASDIPEEAIIVPTIKCTKAG